MITLYVLSLPTCAPCQSQKKTAAAWIKRHPEVKLKVYNVDEDDVEDKVMGLEVNSVPTLVMKSKEVMVVTDGLHSEKDLDEILAFVETRSGATPKKDKK